MTIAEKRNAGLHKNKIGHILWCILRALLFIGLSYIILYPILFCLSISVRLPSDMMDPTVIWLPKSFTLDNFKFVFEHTEFTAAYVRTLLLSLFCSVLQMFSCAVTGYGFARFKFRGRGILFALALLTFVVPPQIISMPLYIQYSKFTVMTGIPMINTIFPSTLSAFFAQGLKAGLFIYLFRQFFKNMPKELEDAAYLDGCGPVKAFTSIMLVNAGPMLLVSFVLSFVWYWNDYINMSLFFNKSKPLAMVLNGLTTTIRGMKLEDGTIFGEIENSVYTTTFCMHKQTFGIGGFRVGDRIAAIDPETLLTVGTAVVKAVQELSPRKLLLELDSPTPAFSAGAAVENLSASPDVAIKNNSFFRIPTRGILVTSRGRVQIKNNLFSDIKMCGILIADDAGSWFESGGVENVTVSGNVFRRSGGPFMEIKPENKRHAGAVHKNISVTGNTIYFPKNSDKMYSMLCPWMEKQNNVILKAKSTDGITFCDNEIIGEEDTCVLSFLNCGGVCVSHNRFNGEIKTEERNGEYVEE